MELHIPRLLTAALLIALPATQALAEGDWTKGRIYYRATCTSCHEADAGGAISPAAYTIAEWTDWIASERGTEHLGQYVGVAYREAVAPDNKVAKAFLTKSDDELWADVEAFVIYGAKDSATPATCN